MRKAKPPQHNIITKIDLELEELRNNIALEDLLFVDHTLKGPMKIDFDRPKTRNEIYTPSWVVKKMTTYLNDRLKEDADSWMDYLSMTGGELCCGHAPFLVMRYDAVTLEPIEFKDRYGIIDLKIKTLFEQDLDDEAWVMWLEEIFKSSYGWDIYSDAIVYARCNVFMTFMEAYRLKFGEDPGPLLQRRFLNIISWNIFQMDGLQLTHPDTGQEVKIMDWQNERVIRFKTLKKEKKDA